jgi:hypothetical protein
MKHNPNVNMFTFGWIMTPSKSRKSGLGWSLHTSKSRFGQNPNLNETIVPPFTAQYNKKQERESAAAAAAHNHVKKCYWYVAAWLSLSAASRGTAYIIRVLSLAE